MPNRVIIMHAGQKVAFATKRRHPEHVLYAREERGKIVFRMKGDPLGRIAGKGMRELLVDPVADTKRDTYVLELLADDDTIQLTTPEQNLRSCIYLDAIRDRIEMVGGIGLIARIEGNGLEGVLDETE